MNKHFFMPLSAYSFPELASAEAISPTAGDVTGAFIGRRNRTKTSGEIPVNPCENLLILYSKPVSWEYKEGVVMDYPLVVRISEESIDADSLLPLTLPTLQQKGISAWAYPKTIFCRNAENVGYLFRSEEEKAQLLQSLSSYQEVKNIKAIKKVVGLWSSCDEVVMLSNDIQNEITQEVERKGHLSSLSQECLRDEIRTGACLGYDIAKMPTTKSAKELLNDIHDSSAKDKAWKRLRPIIRICQFLRDIENWIQSLLGDTQRIEHQIQELQQELQHKKNQLEEKRRKKRAKEQKRFKQQCAFAAVATKQSDVDWRVDETASRDDGLNGGRFKAYYRYVGRKVLEKWEDMDPFLQKTVDFIAAYPPDKWNWVGNDERIAFVRELWNQVLKPSLCETKNEDAIEKMRDEVAVICSHFQSPNDHGLEIGDIKSGLLQSLYVVLECAGDMGTLKMGMEKVKRRDHCLALYGAFKGYTYFPRQLLPECAPPLGGAPSETDITREKTKARRQFSLFAQRILSAVDLAIERSGKKGRKVLKKGAQHALTKLESITNCNDDAFLAYLKEEDGWWGKSGPLKPFNELKKELGNIAERSLFNNEAGVSLFHTVKAI